jgi:hypothetical protein
MTNAAKELDILLDQVAAQAAIAPERIGVHLGKIRDLIRPALDQLAAIQAAALPEGVAEIEHHIATRADKGATLAEERLLGVVRALTVERDSVRADAEQWAIWRNEMRQDRDQARAERDEQSALRRAAETERDEAREVARLLRLDIDDWRKSARLRAEELATRHHDAEREIAEARSEVNRLTSVVRSLADLCPQKLRDDPVTTIKLAATGKPRSFGRRTSNYAPNSPTFAPGAIWWQDRGLRRWRRSTG